MTEPAATRILRIDDVSKSFGHQPVLDSIRLEVSRGDVYALIGPNGAGKTTLLKIVVGLLRPDEGSVTISDYDIQDSPISAKRHFGYVPDDPSAYEYLTGYEFLELTGRLRGLKGEGLVKRIDELVPMFPLSDIIRKPMSSYSRGNRQKVAILAAIMTEPSLLVIDEPIVGLDPVSIRSLGSLLVAYASGGGSVIFVTHIVDFAREYANKAGFLVNGSLVKEVQVTQETDLEGLLSDAQKV